MIVDKELEFSEDQAVTSTANSTNSVDLLAARDIGAEHACVELRVTTALTGTGSVAVELESATAKDFSAGSKKTTLGKLTSSSTGLKFTLAPDQAADQRWIRLVYTVTDTVSTGKVSAYLTSNLDTGLKMYPQNANTKVA